MRKFLMIVLEVFTLCTHLLAKSRTVSGRVTDDKGNGLPDVSIQVKGTPLGTASTRPLQNRRLKDFFFI